MKFLIPLLIVTNLPIQGYAQSEIQDNPIFALQGKHVHSSSIVECPNGDLLACWFYVAISDDNGKHWRASKPIVGLGPIQPSIVRKKDGSLVAYMRDSGNAPYRVLRSTSTDQGESWSPAIDTDIPNPGSSLEVIALQDGRWVMVHNDTEHDRNSLAVALSDDEGKTWKWKRHIGRSDNREKSFAYPSLIQAKDGTLHLTYSYREKKKATIRHCMFNADWIQP